jgi:hypothetical protein
MRRQSTTWREGFALVEILAGLRRDAVVAAMLAAGNAAVVRVAQGAVWEGEADIAVPIEAAAEAGRLALLWERTAQHMQHRQLGARPSRPHKSADPARNAPSGFRSARPCP